MERNSLGIIIVVLDSIIMSLFLLFIWAMEYFVKIEC